MQLSPCELRSSTGKKALIYCRSPALWKEERPKGMHHLALSTLKTSPPGFYGWWTPLGDEGLFSEGPESCKNLHCFRLEQLQNSAYSHTAKGLPPGM